MPSVSVYLTDEEFAALATIAPPGKAPKDVLVRFAQITLAEQRASRDLDYLT